jgi:cellulose synthase/poly-beta-1,6-N-acetylglucosamine synthase-like glycosyltransferase
MTAVHPGAEEDQAQARHHRPDTVADFGVPHASLGPPDVESPSAPDVKAANVPGPTTTAQLRALDALIKLGTAIFPRRVRRQELPPAKVSVIIPAHNEAASIAQTLASVRAQSLTPQEVIVACDNCTDNTEQIAAAEGARTFITYRNTFKKAGALNQVLTLLLPAMDPDEFVMVMDADSALNPGWLESASSVLGRLPEVGAICGIYFGEPGSGLLGQLQRNEYFRYGRSVARQRQAPVLSGTGTMFRVSVLKEILRERGRTLPGVSGELYSTMGITEDNEITFALKTLGYRCIAVQGCETITEVMPTLKHLYRQRLRWQTGTLLDLHAYGVSKVTGIYWLKQLGMYANICGTIVCWAVIIGSLVQHLAVSVVWTAIIVLVTLAARTWTVRRAGIGGIVLSLLVLPEYGYDLFRMGVFIKSLFTAMGDGDVSWNHVEK